MNNANPLVVLPTATASSKQANVIKGLPQNQSLPVKKQLTSAYKDVKDFLSTKTTDTRQKPGDRLPPLGGSSSTPQAGIVLPPIRAKPTPSRDSDSEAGPSPAHHDNNNETHHTDQSVNNNYPPRETTFTNGHAQSANGNNNNAHSNGNTQQANGSSATSNLFVTSQTRQPQQPLSAIPLHPEIAARQQLHKEEEEHIRKNGIRTCPILAVLSIFCCCPMSGLFTAFMALKAENSFYEGEYHLAHTEAKVHRFCLLFTFVCGIMIYAGIVIWILVAIYGE